MQLVDFKCEKFKNLYISHNTIYSYSVVVSYFYESSSFKESCALFLQKIIVFNITK